MGMGEGATWSHWRKDSSLTSSSAAAAAGTSPRRWREDCGGVRGEVTYDHRALVLNGTRRMLFAGEMHYPRSTPEVMLLLLLLRACTFSCIILLPGAQ